MLLQIYHTNDIHADFGFLSRVYSYLAAHRGEQDFYFDSGDFTDLKSVIVQSDRGGAAMALMKLCRPEAMALGNNEIDLGSDDLQRLVNLPLLCANAKHNDGTEIPGLKTHRIFHRCGKRFLVIGLAPYYSARMEPNRYNLFFEMGNIHTTDPIPAVEKILEENRGKYDFSILLSHSGHLVDRELEKRLPKVDLWLEGHSHAVITEKRYSQSGKGQCHQLKHNQILFKFCGYLLDLCLFSLVSERFGRTGTTAFIRRFLISRNSRSRFMIDDAANISIAVLFNSAMVWVMFIR